MDGKEVSLVMTVAHHDFVFGLDWSHTIKNKNICLHLTGDVIIVIFLAFSIPFLTVIIMKISMFDFFLRSCQMVN